MHMMSAFLKSLIVVVGFVFLSGCFTSFVSGKRGCSSFGHSCYGGHGKRSKGMDDNTAEVGPTRFMNGFINDKYFTKHHAKFAPHFMRLYETSRSPPNGDMNMFMKKLNVRRTTGRTQRPTGPTSQIACTARSEPSFRKAPQCYHCIQREKYLVCETQTIAVSINQMAAIEGTKQKKNLPAGRNVVKSINEYQKSRGGTSYLEG